MSSLSKIPSERSVIKFVVYYLEPQILGINDSYRIKVFLEND